MYCIHVDKSMLEIIRAGADMEEARRKLRGLCCRIKGPMIGQCMDTQSFHITVFIRRDLSLNVIVASKPRAAQVFSAVFDPLDGLAGGNRGHNGTHIAWV